MCDFPGCMCCWLSRFANRWLAGLDGPFANTGRITIMGRMIEKIHNAWGTEYTDLCSPAGSPGGRIQGPAIGPMGWLVEYPRRALAPCAPADRSSSLPIRAFPRG